MKLLIVGAGALGKFLGARLLASGCDVTFLVRSHNIMPLKSKGITLESARGNIAVSAVDVTDGPPALSPGDIVIFCVKMQHLAAAITALSGSLCPGVTVLSFQNGIEKEDLLSAAFGPAAVIGGTCLISVTESSPAVVTHLGERQAFTIGELNGESTARVRALERILAAAHLDVEVSPTIREKIWEKFIFLVAFAGITTATRCAIGDVLANPHARSLARRLMEEAAAVAKCSSIRISADLVPALDALLTKLPPPMKSSMLVDLENGRDLEIEWIHGALLRAGRKHGVATPMNEAILGILDLWRTA